MMLTEIVIVGSFFLLAVGLTALTGLAGAVMAVYTVSNDQLKD